MTHVGWLIMLSFILVFVATACQWLASPDLRCQRYGDSAQAKESATVLALAEEQPTIDGVQHADKKVPKPIGVARMTIAEFEEEVLRSRSSSNPEVVDLSRIQWFVLMDGEWIRPARVVGTTGTPAAGQSEDEIWDYRIDVYDVRASDFVRHTYYTREAIGELNLDRFEVELE